MIVRQNGKIAGVCGGLAKTLEIDVMFVRLAFLLTFFIYGIGLGLYLACAMVFPNSHDISEYNKPKLAGVCYYFSKQYGLDLSIVRLIVCLSCSVLPVMLIVYFCLGFCLPKE